jgi:hypothetical protein
MIKLIILKTTRYNNKKFSQLSKSFGLIPLASNLGCGGWYSGLCGEGCWPSCWTAWGKMTGRFFFPCFPWFYGSFEVVSPDSWWLSIICFSLSTGQVTIGTCGNLLPVCVRWSDLLFSSGSSCVSLQMQFSGQLFPQQAEYCPLSLETDSAICHALGLGGWLVPHPPPLWVQLLWKVGLYHPLPQALSAYSFPHFHLLRIWLLAPALSQRLVQCSTPPPLPLIDYSSLFMFVSFVQVEFNLPRSCIGLCSQVVGTQFSLVECG